MEGSWNNIPQELKDKRQWVCYMMPVNPEKGKPDKIPINPHTLWGASSTNPDTWGSFQEAIEQVGQVGHCKRKDETISSPIVGVGFVFNGDGVVGVDFDHCIVDGKIDQWVGEWIRRFNSYVCLRCLDKLAQKSGFKVSVPSVDDFGRDLEQIKRDFWGLRMYAPMGGGDATELLPDMVTYNGLQMGRPTVGNVTLAWQGARNLDKRLEEIKGRWANSVQPMVTVTEDVYGADPQDTQEEAERVKAEKEETRRTPENVTVEGSGTDGVDLARKLGNDLVQGQAQVVKGLGHYL